MFKLIVGSFSRYMNGVPKYEKLFIQIDRYSVVDEPENLSAMG